MLQYSRCKTIRHCSAEYQKADFARHKTVCRWVDDNVEKDFPVEKKEGAEGGKKADEKAEADDWPAGIPRPFTGPAPVHDHSDC
ncbi:hypothetical protein CALCODRAFT_497702 [Calocera cornea HHB12733]|uniref:MYND-type domain-containing protein n=1 Tax=Calocera cornea HHB12733 TaxID=1353952 RepID=A0A165F427_9BASI|nr:hypothetical protein CALCODRAFT_497702 [Calocera cornea HHB12733]